MTTQPSPMDISPQNISGTCSYKCDFSFDYPITSCTATNNGDYLSFSQIESTSTATFNNSKYNVSGCYLYSPSVQLYNGQNVDGELMIVHQEESGGETLYVCIPLSTNGTSNAASNKISEIIDAVSKGAPAQGGSVTQGISDFTLNDFIPMKEFYNYSTSNFNVIAFSSQNAIYISQENASLLQDLIKPYSGNAFPAGEKLFVNKTGPIKGKSATSNDIYIDCQPTNSSEDDTNEVVNIKSETIFDANNIFSNPIFMFLVFAFIFTVIIVGINKGIHYFTGENGVINIKK